MKTVTESKRLLKNQARDGHFCHCGEPATMGITDAIQIEDGWEESAMRYGCGAHPVEGMVIFLDGTTTKYSEFKVQ